MIGLILAAVVTSGTWSMQTADGKTQLDMRWSDGSGHHQSENGHTVKPSDYDVSSFESMSGHGTFKQHREAGDFAFEGWMASGNGGGSYTFTQDDQFFADLAREGYRYDEMSEKIAVANLDITREYVRQIEGLGFHPDPSNLIAFRALDITPEWAKHMMDAGITDMSEREMVALRALRVDENYLRDLASVGYPHLAARDLVTLKAMKIDSAYVKYLQAHGFKDISIHQLIEMKAMKV